MEKITIYGNFPYRIPMELHGMWIGFIVMDSESEKSLIMCIFNINNSHCIKLCSNTIELLIHNYMEYKNMKCMVIFKIVFWRIFMSFFPGKYKAFINILINAFLIRKHACFELFKVL